jgi:L-threonylcarbamoyladenylate synthase
MTEPMVSQDDILKAAQILRSGGLVVFPTETVYGLGANALDPVAVRKIFELKGRPSNSPLIVHVSSIAQARALATEWLPEAERLAQRYWPGPLTLVIPKKSFIPDEVTAGLQTVGVRIPRHPVALALLREAGIPIAAPSANRFAKLSPTTAQHVQEAFGDDTPFLLDGGPCEVGLESTVIAVSKEGLEVLRPGMALVEEASASTGNATEESHRAPGQHKKHYSPRTRVILVNRGHLPQSGNGAYLWLAYNASAAKKLRMPGNPAEYAALLYKTLHELDRDSYDWIAVEIPPETQEWGAIRDRLLRASY